MLKKKISSSEGAIDRISFEIQRPNTDPKNFIIRDKYIFMLFTHRLQLKVWVKYGILNMGFQVIKMIKIIIPFPKECVLLANEIYPNRYQIGTPFTAQQIDREKPQVIRKCNRIISSQRSIVEIAERSIAKLKAYIYISYM